MKKLMSIVTLSIVMLFLATCAIAENTTEITLPNGLEFGMPLDKATAVSGYARKSPQYNSQEYARIAAVGFDTDYISGKATIGGYDVTANFYFINGNLKQAEYIFGSANRSGDSRGNDPTLEKSHTSVETELGKIYGRSNDNLKHQYDASNLFSSEYTWRENNKNWEAWEMRGGSRRLVNISSGSVYIENYIRKCFIEVNTGSIYDRLEDRYIDKHVLTYTYYDFQVNNETKQNSSVGF